LPESWPAPHHLERLPPPNSDSTSRPLRASARTPSRCLRAGQLLIISNTCRRPTATALPGPHPGNISRSRTRSRAAESSASHAPALMDCSELATEPAGRRSRGRSDARLGARGGCAQTASPLPRNEAAHIPAQPLGTPGVPDDQCRRRPSAGRPARPPSTATQDPGRPRRPVPARNEAAHIPAQPPAEVQLLSEAMNRLRQLPMTCPPEHLVEGVLGRRESKCPMGTAATSRFASTTTSDAAREQTRSARQPPMTAR